MLWLLKNSDVHRILRMEQIGQLQPEQGHTVHLSRRVKSNTHTRRDSSLHDRGLSIIHPVRTTLVDRDGAIPPVLATGRVQSRSA